MKKSEKKTEEVIEKQSPAPAASPETEILLENEGKAGGILKQARLRQGKKLPDIAQSLCIRKAYLEAIEESRDSRIPLWVGFYPLLCRLPGRRQCPDCPDV